MARAVPNVLRECHRLRRHLRELQSEIDLGPRVQKIQDQTLAAAEAAHKEAHDAVRRLKLKQKDDEVSLKTTETRLAKLQVDVNSAGSKKEYDLKLTEIATSTQGKSDLEDAVLTGIGDIEDRTAGLPAADAAWKRAQADHAAARQEGVDRLARLKADQVDSAATLATTEAELPVDVAPLYLRLVRQYGPDALAGVHARTCQQCRTTITEAARVSLAGGAFLCCTQCGRGLYPTEG